MQKLHRKRDHILYFLFNSYVFLRVESSVVHFIVKKSIYALRSTGVGYQRHSIRALHSLPRRTKCSAFLRCSVLDISRPPIPRFPKSFLRFATRVIHVVIFIIAFLKRLNK